MTPEQHSKEVDKLHSLEKQLIDLIAKTNNLDLMAVFGKWQDQRNVCNEGYLKWMESELNPKSNEPRQN